MQRKNLINFCDEITSMDHEIKLLRAKEVIFKKIVYELMLGYTSTIHLDVKKRQMEFMNELYSTVCGYDQEKIRKTAESIDLDFRWEED